MNTTSSTEIISGVAHFRISGEGLSRLVRGIAAEGRWEHAIRLLREIEGIPIEDIEGIIDGRRVLNGNEDGMEVEDADPANPEIVAHKEQMSFAYDGRCRHVSRNRWMVPYAVVTSWGREDLAGRLSRVAAKDSAARSRHYADEKGDAATHEEWSAGGRPFLPAPPDDDCYLPRHGTRKQGGGIVLWARCDPPPYWRENLTTPSEAWAAWLAAGHHPEERGWDRTYGPAYRADALAWAEKAAVRATEEKATEGKEKAERLRRAAEAAARAEKDAEARAMYVHALRGRLEARCGGLPTADIVWVEDGAEKIVPVPRALLAACAVYALRLGASKRDVFADALDLWQPTAPAGLKMTNDDVWHSDLCLVMGADLDAEYDHAPATEARKSAVYHWQWEIQRLYEKGGPPAVREWIDGRVELKGEGFMGEVAFDPGGINPPTSFPAVVLCGGGVVEGVVVQPGDDEEVPAGSIVVIQNADAEHYIAAVSAHRNSGGAVMCETGGALSHLAVEGQEAGFRLVRVEAARVRFPVGSRVRVDLGCGIVEIIKGDS